MNGVHDMGGMHGLGALDPEPNEPVWHAVWEARVFALSTAIGAWGRWTIDASRFRLEQMPPSEYLRTSYYERWLYGMVENAVAHGLITRAEAETGRPDLDATQASPPLRSEHVFPAMDRGSPKTRPFEGQPLFRLGDTVRTKNIQPRTHTRLPRYARDKQGTIVSLHGAHVFPDTNALFQGENPQPLYTVRFQARELWGADANPRDTICLDLWESYLVPA